MLVVGFAAGVLRANCYLLAPAAGSRCIIVDPGQDALAGVEKALGEHDLTPVAVLVTHGHADHAESAGTFGLPVWLHPGDRDLVPISTCDLAETTLELAGLAVHAWHTPGHTPGSMIFRLDTHEGGRVVLTGDTVFAGSVGRGDRETLAASVRDKLLPLPDDTVVLPGHGNATTIGRERAFLSGQAVAR
ncbi:MBL fold metallo-hydrolase [Amycolatopsis alkalitolerans]|uniref:MBL fold metallo-hydrolase n=1 Tax=Amycolatopsis alkalitolerans TaxID=2547244 RepID=A0A5C4LVW6_9PSEU|nr:MBL fold metallo-hydrolase [Amycolatopsis alkalitolerans]TNC22220.1 MBL fold metallo-hydrolase [Amycolatopsis alkalitolerans]